MIAERLTVGVKFCGSCNPEIPAQEILQQLKQKVAEAGLAVTFVPWDTPGLDVLLVLSGCPVDCAGRPAGSYPEIAVSGENVNRSFCSCQDISGKILSIIQEYHNNKL